jgi:septal ring factor EnvC (AmiA/AmiB activator)
MRREMDQEKNDMAAEIERLERELQETADKASTLDKELDAARKGRATAENQVTGLRIENARLDERAKAAEGRAGEMKTQLDGLQARLAGG